jgi:NAD(P)-dependent dehydrogenase (short-subunit alcohol dehydrogenase family)
MVHKTLQQLGRIDILVNNAGGSFNAPLLEMSEGAWDAIIRENLKSVFLCSQAVGKIMREQKRGSIINIASVAGLGSYSSNASYGAAKAGIINLTKTLAIDLAPYYVRVNAIAPGYIETPGIVPLFQAHADLLQTLTKRVPLGRVGKPEDIAGVAIYLASDASDYVTGTTVIVDGGLTSVVG